MAWQAVAFLWLPISDARSAVVGWVEVGDHAVREEVRRLIDEGDLSLPSGAWPVPRDALEDAISRAVAERGVDPMQFDRLRRLFEAEGDWSVFAAVADVPRLREPGASWRSASELGIQLSIAGGPSQPSRSAHVPWNAAIAVSVARSDAGQQRVLFDGSHMSVRWGNWLLGASVQDRYWGPGHDGSLILSDNARPMPSVFVERATSEAFKTPLLSWIGPWRASLFASLMESERQDVDRPLFLGARVTVLPRPWLNIGFSRTAQTCGRGRPCNLKTLKDLLLGNDNLGIDATSATEPGNQMAGFDVRIRSPWAGIPVAVYSQMIGEDESGYLPVKYLGQFGVETWRVLPGGGQLRAFLEYADTTCSFNRPEPRFNCAYVQGVFNREGYRYRGRSIAHGADGDAELWSAGLRWRTPRSDEWNAHLRTGTLNRDAGIDTRNTVSAFAADYSSASVGWRGARGWGDLQVLLGVERYEPLAGGGAAGGFGSLRLEKTWR